MIQTAGHVVNAVLAPLRDGPTLPVVAGVDFTASVANVSAWGGQAWLYALAVRRGLDAARPEVGADLARSIGSLAGWRSGVLDLRGDARTRLGALLAVGRDDVAAAVLGLPVRALRDFAGAQEHWPLAWPLLAPSATVASVGGFRGLGGPWTAPPWLVERTTAGRLVVSCADGGRWRLEADVFGHRLTPQPETPELAGMAAVAGATVSERSYLVALTGELV